MGAWGYQSFENDDACDWVGNLLDSPGKLKVIQETLQITLKCLVKNQDDAPICSTGMAAAEIVAAIHQHSADRIPHDLKERVLRQKSLEESLVKHTLQVVNEMETRSELRELWRESDEFDKWKASVDAIKQRLLATKA